jgi:hypothetical protein
LSTSGRPAAKASGPRAYAQGVETVDQFLEGDGAGKHHEPAVALVVDLDVGARHGDRGATRGDCDRCAGRLPRHGLRRSGDRLRRCSQGREGIGLGNLRRLGDADRQIALGDGDGIHPYAVTHDDGAGFLVDDDAGNAVGFDQELLDIRDQADDVTLAVLGQRDADRAGIGCGGDRLAGEAVDRLGHAPGGGEVRIAQGQVHSLERGELEAGFTLDDGAVGDTAGGWRAARDALGSTSGREAGDRHRTLGHGIDLAIGAEQRADE